MTAWTEDDEMLAIGYAAIGVIDWTQHNVLIHYKHQSPPPEVTNFLINKHGQGGKNMNCYLVDQYFLPIKEVLNFKLWYHIAENN